jgi:CheY-like chemotaxis protein
VLQNAIKFTAKGGRVTARLARTDAGVELVVADSGRGIRPDFLPFVFERFRQADSSTTRAEGGLGLGLAITKHIVELHGGTVIAQSRGEGHGATFTIALPAQVLEAPSASSTPGRSAKASSSGVYLSPGNTEKVQGLSGVKILVCDDDEDGRELLAAVLAAEGADTVTAANGSAVLAAFREFGPHVLVSDVGMPHIDGYELIRQIRAMPEDEGGQVPAIALTAHAGGEDELKALLAGYQVYVTKPIDPSRLVQIVGNLVGRPIERKRERPGS